MDNQSYSFLPKQVMKCIYEKRKSLDRNILYNARIEKVERGNYVEIWFMTKGCQWDAKGGCTICNYGKGCEIADDVMVQSVADAMSGVDVKIGELAITPSGSFLDEEEVPRQVRKQIFELVNQSDAHTFLFETRAQTVTDETVKELVSAVKDKKLIVEMGLETESFFIQKYCINKGYFLKEYENAVAVLKKYHVLSYANVILGAPFLSYAQAIEDCKKTINWALENGTDKVVLFVLHVKPGTLLEWLYEHGYYNPVSLWGLVEVLDSLDDEKLQHVEISWYKNYYTDKSKIIASPYTCDECYDDVIQLLDEFRENPSRDVLDKLKHYQCTCKEQTEQGKQENLQLNQVLYEQYGEITQELLGQDYWRQNRQLFKQELERDYEKYNPNIECVDKMEEVMTITDIETYIPETMGKIKGNEVSKTYQGIYNAYQHLNHLSDDNLCLPAEQKMDCDEMAAKVLEKLINSGVGKEQIGFLADCRSSITGKVPAPTYKVAVLNDVKSVLPFSIQGQAGTEMVQAFLILKQLIKESGLKSGCICMTQKLNEGDERDKDGFYYFADGAAALCLKKGAASGFQIIGAAISRPEDYEAVLGSFIRDTCKEHNVQVSDLAWIICHNVKNEIYHQLEKKLEWVEMIRRNEYETIDFGCADPFISLEWAVHQKRLKDKSIGGLLFIGRTGHIGIILVKYRK